VPDRIRAPLNATELSARDSILDRPSSHSQLQQLPSTDDSVLGLCQLPNPLIDRTKRRFTRH